VIFPDLLEAQAAPIVTRLREELLQRPVSVPGASFALEASIGVAVSEPGMDADALLVAADRALYEDKARARQTLLRRAPRRAHGLRRVSDGDPHGSGEHQT
jgi:PleD family two-component response regulator